MKKQDGIAMTNVLISGASFVSLGAAYWMNELGYDVMLIEIAKGLWKGGTPVDIRDRTVAIVDRMEILGAIKANSLPPRSTEFRTAANTVVVYRPPQSAQQHGTTDRYEIERDALL